VTGVKVELIGTDCVVTTDNLGAFDFGKCDTNQTRRLSHPIVSLYSQDGRLCAEIPLRPPPRVTEMLIELDTCRMHIER
jgi:hypothetical protein